MVPGREREQLSEGDMSANTFKPTRDQLISVALIVHRATVSTEQGGRIQAHWA